MNKSNLHAENPRLNFYVKLFRNPDYPALHPFIFYKIQLTQ